MCACVRVCVCVCVCVSVYIYILFSPLAAGSADGSTAEYVCAWTRASVRVRRVRIKSGEDCHMRAAQTPKALTLNPKF